MNRWTRRSTSRLLAFIVILVLAVVVLPASAASNKWRLALDGRAKVDGEIELTIVPKGGAVTPVVIPIPAGTSENHAAVMIRDALSKTFGSVYHVETDDGEDVLVKAKGSTPDFDLTVARNTVDGLKAKLSKE